MRWANDGSAPQSQQQQQQRRSDTLLPIARGAERDLRPARIIISRAGHRPNICTVHTAQRIIRGPPIVYFKREPVFRADPGDFLAISSRAGVLILIGVALLNLRMLFVAEKDTDFVAGRSSSFSAWA